MRGIANVIAAVRAVPRRAWAWTGVIAVGMTAAGAAFAIGFTFGVYGPLSVGIWLHEPVRQTLFLRDVWTAWGHLPSVQQAMRTGAFFGLITGGVATIGLAKAFGLADRPALFGVTSFGSWRELVKGRLLDKGRRAGVVLGRWRRAMGSGPLVSHATDWTHVFVLGPTGCGKGQGFVLPNGLNWPDSLIAFDLKGEAWEKTAGYRAKVLDNDVFYFNPTDRQRRTCRFNPLGHVVLEDAVELIAELKKVAEMLLPIPDVGEKFWAQSGQVGFVAAGMVVAQRDGKLSIGRILQELKRHDLLEYFSGIAAGEVRAGTKRFSSDCQLQCSSFAASGDERTFGNKRDTLTAALGLWDDPNVRVATEESDFDLREMRRAGRKKMSVYLCASAGNLKVLRPLYSCIFQLLYDQLTAEEPAKGDHGVLVILDEFARLGRMSDLQAAFALTRSYKMRFLIVVQSLNQLKDAALYGVHGAEDIAINCDTQVFFTPTQLGDAKALSEMLGYNTIRRRSRTRQSRGGSSLSEAEHQRALMLPQELMEFPDNEVLVKTRGRRAFRLKKIKAWSDTIFAKRMAMAPPARVSLPPAPAAADAIDAAEAAFKSMIAGGLATMAKKQLSADPNAELVERIHVAMGKFQG